MMIVHPFICNFVLFFLSQTASSEISKYYYSATPGKYQISYINDLSINGPFKHEGYVRCSCKEWSKLIEIPNDYLEEIFLDLINHRTCEGHRICDLLRSCLHCNTQFWVCKTHPGNIDIQDCVQRTFNWLVMNNHRLLINRGLSTPYRGSLSTLLTRNRRDALGKCAYPRYMRTSDVICLRYDDPNIIKCRQNCLFGHTLEEGITRTMTCNFLEGEWKPRGFEECSPFVDCNLSLKSPGYMSCDPGTSVTPPSCNVTCSHYEDHSEVYRSVQCRIYGGWSKRLPFCATRSRNMELVPAPRTKLHPLSYDPYFRTSENKQEIQGAEQT